jgi:hypothetical protein
MDDQKRSNSTPEHQSISPSLHAIFSLKLSQQEKIIQFKSKTIKWKKKLKLKEEQFKTEGMINKWKNNKISESKTNARIHTIKSNSLDFGSAISIIDWETERFLQKSNHVFIGCCSTSSATRINITSRIRKNQTKTNKQTNKQEKR